MCVCFWANALVFSGNRHLAHHCAIVAVASATDAAAGAFASTRNEQAFDMHSNNKRAIILNEQRLELNDGIRQTVTEKAAHG